MRRNEHIAMLRQVEWMGRSVSWQMGTDILQQPVYAVKVTTGTFDARYRRLKKTAASISRVR